MNCLQLVVRVAIQAGRPCESAFPLSLLDDPKYMRRRPLQHLGDVGVTKPDLSR